MSSSGNGKPPWGSPSGTPHAGQPQQPGWQQGQQGQQPQQPGWQQGQQPQQPGWQQGQQPQQPGWQEGQQPQQPGWQQPPGQPGWQQPPHQGAPIPQKKKGMSGCTKAFLIGCAVLVVVGIGVGIAAYLFVKELPKNLVRLAKMHPAYGQSLRAISEVPAVKKHVGRIKDVEYVSYKARPSGIGLTLRIKGEKASALSRMEVGISRGRYSLRTLKITTSKGQVLDLRKNLLDSIRGSKAVKDLIRELNKSPNVKQGVGQVLEIVDLPVVEVRQRKGRGVFGLELPMRTAKGTGSLKAQLQFRQNFAKVRRLTIDAGGRQVDLTKDVILALNTVMKDLFVAANSSPEIQRAVGRVKGFSSLPRMITARRSAFNKTSRLVADVECEKGKARIALILRQRFGRRQVQEWVLLTADGRSIRIPYVPKKKRKIRLKSGGIDVR